MAVPRSPGARQPAGRSFGDPQLTTPFGDDQADGRHSRPRWSAAATDGADDQFPNLKHLWVDQGYTGSGRHWIEAQLGWSVEVVRHTPRPQGEWVPHGDRRNWRTVWFSWQRLPPAPKIFRGVLPRRWVVERTFAWLSQNRRFSRDTNVSTLPAKHSSMQRWGGLMLRRLARN